MNTVLNDAPEFIELREACRILGSSPNVVHRLRRDGHIGVRQLPGGNCQFVRADVERLASRAIQPARHQTVEA